MSCSESKTKNNGKRRDWIKKSWDYHCNVINELDVAVDWADWDQDWCKCWACGDFSTLQKCHLTPKSLGGSEDPSNIVPLCRRCHYTAPDVIDPQVMLKWIAKQSSQSLCLDYEDEKGVTRTIGSWGRQTQTLLDCIKNVDMSEFDYALLQEGMSEAFEKTSYHFGQSGQGAFTKDSTREWIIVESFKLYAEKREALNVAKV